MSSCRLRSRFRHSVQRPRRRDRILLQLLPTLPPGASRRSERRGCNSSSHGQRRWSSRSFAASPHQEAAQRHGVPQRVSRALPPVDEVPS